MRLEIELRCILFPFIILEMASIVLQWKKFGTTKTLPRVCPPVKLSNWRRALVRELTKNPMVTPVFLCGDNHLCSTPPIRPFW